jgi:prevent-host-death family protein
MRANILEAKNQLSRLIKLAQAGEEVIIANRGEPVACLVPAPTRPETRSEACSGRAILEWIRRHPAPDYARRSAEEIDAAIEAERESWG